MTPVIIICSECNLPKPKHAKGMCNTCYTRKWERKRRQEKLSNPYEYEAWPEWKRYHTPNYANQKRKKVEAH